MLPEPPFPIKATFKPPNQYLVTFSTWLQPGPLNLFTWRVRHAFRRYTMQAAEVIPDYRNPVVLLTRGLHVIDLGPNNVSYLPPPSDVRSRIGDLAAPGFAMFPPDF